MDEKQKDAIQIIGNAIREGRKRRYWSQKDLAAFMKVDTSLISKWENGKAVPTGADLFRMAIELDIVPLLFSDYFPQDAQESSPSLQEEIKQLKRESMDIKQRLSKIEEEVIVGGRRL